MIKTKDELKKKKKKCLDKASKFFFFLVQRTYIVIKHILKSCLLIYLLSFVMAGLWTVIDGGRVPNKVTAVLMRGILYTK